jgi:hypothetical protein
MDERQYRARLISIALERTIADLDKNSKTRKDMEEILKEANKVAYSDSEKLEDVGKWFGRD